MTEPSVAPASLDAAKQFHVVTNLNSMDHIMLKHLGFPHVEVATTVSDAIRMFFGKRAELIAFDQAVLADEFHAAGFDASDAVPVLTVFKTPPYMAMSKSTPDSVARQIRAAYD